MNKRIERLRQEEEKLKKHRKAANKTSFLGIIICVALGVGITAIAPSYYGKTVEPNEDKAVSSQAEIKPRGKAEVMKEEPVSTAEKEDDWRLLVVNRTNTLPEDFKVTLKDFKGERVDERIYKSLEKMLDDAAKEGIELTVCSGYRSVETQNVLFERKVKEWMDTGMGEEASVLETQKYLQPPGASEHHTGLAVDIISPEYTTLDSGFADTDAYKWLEKNAAKYGFIERYKEDKEDITGVSFEPWHYRYTGVELAKKINASGLCLEEYVKKGAK